MKLEILWQIQARREQLIPEWQWLGWLIRAGRGYGKTRTGAEWTRRKALANANSRIALIGRTFTDGRDTMVEGESGLLQVIRVRKLIRSWNRSLGELTLANGTQMKLFSSKKPDALRGPQHHYAWGDEPAHWIYPTETHDMLMLGLRLGQKPQYVYTTTPKPIKLMRELSNDSDVHLTLGSTYENLENLAPPFKQQVLRRYEGTTLGLQELYGRLLEETPGALWKRKSIALHKVTKAPELVEIVVGVDPNVSSGQDSDECGIVVVGKDRRGHGYVLQDASARVGPQQWASRSVGAYVGWDADWIVAEVNNGGDLVEIVINNVDESVPVYPVHASRGKRTRAEPIAQLYEQGKIHHVGVFEELEDQMCNWVPGEGESPDRVDALVWALWKLFVEKDETADQPVMEYEDRVAISPF